MSETISIPYEINEATLNLTKGFKNILLKLSNQDNALIVANYLISMKHEVNISGSYRIFLIKVLSQLSRHVNEKDFLNITRDDFLSFLNSFRNTEPVDPLHKWTGTYDHYLIIRSRFFKWLYHPDIPQKERQNKKPPVIENISKLQRKDHLQTY